MRASLHACAARGQTSSPRALLASLLLAGAALLSPPRAAGEESSTAAPGSEVARLSSLPLEDLAGVEVFSVSKAPEPLARAEASIYVITHDEILRSGASNLVGAGARAQPRVQPRGIRSRVQRAGRSSRPVANLADRPDRPDCLGARVGLPDVMRAIEISSPGGPEVLKPTTRPVPQPGPGEVLVRVEAAAVNGPDLAQRRGVYPPPPGASDLPGLDIAGVVVAHGPGVELPAVGSRVCALVTGGGYAEYCVAAAPLCLPIPGKLTAIEAASLPETYFTVWNNLIDRGRLVAGETALVQGGASGIGVAALQLGTALGARMLATAGSAAKCAACERLGAVRAIDYTREDFVAVAREVTGGKGLELILDMVAGDYVARELEALAPEGRLVIIATQGGSRAQVDMRVVMSKRLTISGSTLRPRPVAFKAALARNLERTVWPLIEQGRIRPVIHATLPLDQAAEGHRLLESRGHIGKVVLSISGA